MVGERDHDTLLGSSALLRALWYALDLYLRYYAELELDIKALVIMLILL